MPEAPPLSVTRACCEICGGADSYAIDYRRDVPVFQNKVYRTADIDRGDIAIRYRGREGDVDTGRMIFSYEGSTADSNGDGKVDPYEIFTNASRSAFQLGLRYAF